MKIKYKHEPNKKYIAIKVKGNSMFPLIKHNNIVIIEINNKTVYKKKDIILFSVNDKYFIHRIIYTEKVRRNYFLTKGDNNKSLDNWLVEDCDIIGKVVAVLSDNELFNDKK